jgi:hypothetical protein
MIEVFQTRDAKTAAIFMALGFPKSGDRYVGDGRVEFTLLVDETRRDEAERLKRYCARGHHVQVDVGDYEEKYAELRGIIRRYKETIDDGNRREYAHAGTG